MHSSGGPRVPAPNVARILVAAAAAALISGCSFPKPSSLWDSPQTPETTGSVAPVQQPAADPIVTGTSQPYTPYSQGQPAQPPSQVAVSRAIYVQPGETVYSIAKRNRTTVQAIAIANNLRAPYSIRTGQRLMIPGARADYTATGSVSPTRQPAPRYGNATRPAEVIFVKPGETLYSISKRYGIHVNNLARYNRIPPPFNLKLGQRIEIPARAGVAQNSRALRLPARQQAPRAAAPAAATQAVAAAPGRANTSPNKDYIYYFHKVKSGETLPAIAQQYRIDPATLATFNQLPPQAKLRTGQVIRVPM